MLSVVVLNDEGNVLIQYAVNDAQELVKIDHDGGVLSVDTESPPLVLIDGMIILAKQTQKPKQIVPMLSPKQLTVLQYLASSLTPMQIAVKMGVTLPTIRMHINEIKKKFNAETRDQMMAKAGCLGLCDPFKKESNGKGWARTVTK